MVLASSFFHALCFLECCSRHWVPNHMTKLNLRLNEELIGQPLAHRLILQSLSAHINSKSPSKALVLSLHGGTGTGKNFIAQHIVESLYRKGFQSRYVRLYVASKDFMHNDEEHLRDYKNRLKHDIETTTSACEQSIFIFDEVDKMSLQVLEVILYYIDFHTPTYAQPVDFRKTIFLFLSNNAAKEINRIVRNNFLKDVRRENYDIVELQKAIANAAFAEKGGLWHASLIEKHLVTFFVPFLPLERRHVRTCIARQLIKIFTSEKYHYKISNSEITDQVLALLEFVPEEQPLYSVSGCKSVQQRITYVLESNRVFVHDDL